MALIDADDDCDYAYDAYDDDLVLSSSFADAVEILALVKLQLSSRYAAVLDAVDLTCNCATVVEYNSD